MNRYIVIIALFRLIDCYASVDIDVEMGLSATVHRIACTMHGVLDLRYQNIIALPYANFGNVHTLNLSHNSIADFDLQKLLVAMPHMRTLDVSANNIQELRVCMLKHMPRGFSLDVSDNPIRSVERGVERAIGQLCDKDVVIRCYNLLLEERRLHRIQGVLEGASDCHKVRQLGIAALGFCGIITGVVLLVSSEGPCQQSAADLVVSSPLISSALSEVCRHSGVFALGISSICVSLGLLCVRHIIDIVWHDMHRSKLYW
jgi:hypothetical protein